MTAQLFAQCFVQRFFLGLARYSLWVLALCSLAFTAALAAHVWHLEWLKYLAGPLGGALGVVLVHVRARDIECPPSS